MRLQSIWGGLFQIFLASVPGDTVVLGARTGRIGGLERGLYPCYAPPPADHCSNGTACLRWPTRSIRCHNGGGPICRHAVRLSTYHAWMVVNDDHVQDALPEISTSPSVVGSFRKVISKKVVLLFRHEGFPLTSALRVADEMRIEAFSPLP